MDGLAATRAIRAGETLQPDIPVVALSANAFHEDRAAALAAGADTFTAKPVTRESLAKAIDEASNRRSGASPTPLRNAG
jgi:CheY-like chemotaxis protein